MPVHSVHAVPKLSPLVGGGLSDAAAAQRLAEDGPNQLPNLDQSAFQILLKQTHSAFFVILFLAAGLSFLLGQQIDAVLIVIFLTLNVVIGFWQERHAAQTAELLEKFTVGRATVWRGHRQVILDITQIVRGDLVQLQAGDIVPADIQLLHTDNLQIDESTLSGESVPIEKLATTASALPDQRHTAYAGTSVIAGKAVGVVFKTGAHSSLGKIAVLTTKTERPNQLNVELQKISRLIFIMVSVTTVCLLIGHMVFRPGQDLPQLLLFFVALGVGVIPEALPVVVSFSLSRGARRLAKRKVIVKELSAIEELGSIEILCSDKTGTLTQNKLKVVDTLNVDSASPLAWMWAASPTAFHQTITHQEPFDLALEAAVKKLPKLSVRRWKLLDSVPFNPESRTQQSLVRTSDGVFRIIRGAPEVVARLCAGQKHHTRVLNWMSLHGQQGHRVLAVAIKREKTITRLHTAHLGSNYSFVGVVAFADPLRATAKQAVAHAHQLGVKIKIITGDLPEVAAYIAREVGLMTKQQLVLTGRQFEQLSLTEQGRAVEQYEVFARFTPEQKYRVIELLESHGRTVGYIGDGINDAPALKKAHVGITVSGAVEVARDAADIILLEQSLETIVYGIETGREIFANVMKYLRIAFASTFGNFYTIAITSLLLAELPMLPLQILLVNLLTDLPLITIASDSVDADEIQRVPSHGIGKLFKSAIVFGLISTTFDFIFFALFWSSSPAILQTSWFVMSILTELVFTFSLHTRRLFFWAHMPPRSMIVANIFAGAIAIILPLTMFGQTWFSFAPSLGFDQLKVIFMLVTTYGVVNEVAKLIYFRNKQLLP